MKTKLRRISRRSLSMLLSVLIVVSSFIIIGTVTASAITWSDMKVKLGTSRSSLSTTLNCNSDGWCTWTASSDTTIYFKYYYNPWSLYFGTKNSSGEVVSVRTGCLAYQNGGNQNGNYPFRISVKKGITYGFKMTNFWESNDRHSMKFEVQPRFPNAGTLFVDAQSYWPKTSGHLVGAYFCNGGSSGEWVQATKCSDPDGKLYRITTPSSLPQTVILVTGSSISDKNWNTITTQTDDIEAENGLNYKITSAGTGRNKGQRASYGTSSVSTHTTHTLTRYKYIRDNSSVSTYTQSGSATTTNPACSSSTVNLNDSFTAPSGYTLDGWYTTNSSGTLTGAVASPTAVTNKVSATYYAAYTHNKVNVTFKNESGTGGTVSQGSTQVVSSLTTSGTAVSTDYNRSLAYTIYPADGKKITAVSGGGTWSIASGGTSATCTFKVTSATTVTVTQADAGTCGFTLSKSSTTLNIGGTDTITVTPNAYHSGGTISAESSNTSVATVSYNTSTNKATITAKSHGTATITISCTEGGSATISVTVNTPTISIALGSSSLNIGGTTTITPTVTNQGTATVTYTSSNTSVATISGTTITAVAPGTTNITATVDGVTSTAKTLTVNTPTINVTNNTTIKVGATYTPSATLTNPSTASGKWTVDYVKKSGTTATTNGTTITAVNYGSKTTFTAQYKYDGTVVATKDFDVTPVTPSISAYSYSAINVGGTANPSVTKSNVDNMTVSYSVKSGSAVTINSTSGQITGVVPTASNATTVTVTYTYGSCTVSRDATVTVNTPTVTMADKTVAKGDSVTFSATTSNPSGLTIEYAVNPAVANVSINSSTGVVTVEKACTASSATITASAKNSSGTVVATKNATLTIVDPQLVVKNGSTTLTSTSTVYMTKGGSDITLDTSATNFNDTLYFKSSNTSIATVGKNTGVIHAEAKGTTTITVANWDLDTRAVGDQSLTFTVNVSEADTNKYIYFTNGVGWTGVKAYLWKNSNTSVNNGWPGESMVKIGKDENNQDVYALAYDSSKGYDRVIISNSSYSDQRVKIGDTSDLTLSSSENGFWCNEANNGANDKAGRWNCTIVKPQITANNVTIDMGSTQTMTATVLTSGTPSTFNWSSGTKSIATVANTHTASNVISGVAPGNSTITVKAYAAKPSGWASIVTDGTADDYVAGTATATATVVAEDKKVTFGAKKTDDGSTFTDLSDAVTAKYYDADTSGSGSSGSGSGSSGSSGSDPEPSGGPYYLHIGKQNAFITNTAIEFTWNGSYYYASYNVDTANADYPFVINTKNTALGDSDKSSSNQSITALASSNNPDNISMWYTPVYNSYYGYDAFKFGVNSGSTGTIYITFTPSGGVTFRTSVSSGSGGSGSGGSGSGGSGSGSYTPGEGTAMTSPQSVPYGKVAVFTAEATKTVSDVTYHFAEWVDGSGNKLSSDNPYQITVTADKTVYARYYRVYKLSAFDSYTSDGTNVSFVTSPPKIITVKHGNDIYTYRYDGTALPGNPDSPDEGITKPQALPVASGGTYGQGNYIQYYAGDEITLHYSAMSSSEIFKGVFYNNSENYYVAKPTAEGFIAHDYTTEHTLYMNSAYYAIVPSGLPTTTVDNDDHTIKFTGTKDFKNIDVEMATKRKVYFSDYTNAVIGSKNTDDYYYDGEALSVTGDQLTVKAAKSASQTNVIVGSSVGFYKATAEGGKGEALTASEISTLGLSVTNATSTSTSSADGTALVISGNMPSYDLYIDLGMTNSYTIKLGSKLVSDLGGSKTRLREAATAVTATSGSTTLSCTTSADLASGSASVVTGSSVELTVSGLESGYMFVGWYWGSDSAPDYEKGFISDKTTLNYTPKKGGTIWAVGTKGLYINGSKYITGKDTDWYSENGVWKNQEMKFDADSGRYYWEITDTMFAAAGNEYKTWEENNNNTTYGTYHKGGDNYYYWYDNDDKYHGKSFFQLFDTESGNNNKSIWNQLTSFKVDTPANGPTYGKIYPSADDYGTKTWNGQGFINFYESSYPGYSSPLRIYYDPNATNNAKLTVEATPIYSDIYVSNGYDVGSTVKSDAVTVEPVVDGVVKTSGQTGYFSVGAGTTYSPDHEGTVTKYTPAKKGATVRITKKAGGSDKIAAFLIYDTENRTVRAEKNITKGTTSNSKTPYYIDLTLENVKQSLYIVPIVEEAVPNGAKQVTITFDATQLNRKQWGDIVTAYAWYKTSNAPGLGAYPGQPMIPSDDMSTWTTSFVSIKSGNELAGITFSNYVDGTHSWLGCTGVMGTVSDAQQKSGEATGGIINVYNHVDSGDNGVYSRTNYKAQTYDYHEPIALYDRYKNEDSVNITFQMKDGNSSLISWRHSEFDDYNILNLPSGWGKLNWEYLTNAKGDQYVDMNGSPLGANNKPTATFYVAAKGQVVYNNSTMNYVFHGGHDYEMKGYTGTYSDPTGGADRGSYAKTALASGQWDDNITYGGTNSLDMKYGVQWYVYDAQGNYITTVLSAGIADLSSNNVDTYIAKELEDKGYAVDGKSVAICYDKPRYMYGDWNNVTNSANNINCGPNFDAYRFEGQWIAAAQSDTVKVNVEVAMMTDSGEVLANSNTTGYGNATASLATGVTFGKPVYATTASDGSWAQTAATDAKLNGIQLDASSQNFIGWYYYDANTNEFTKATYTNNEDFRPNYTNKDVTYYAVYRASAIYQYHYRGREKYQTYSASGNDLSEYEMGHGSVIRPEDHEADIKLKVPVGIGIFKENIDFTADNDNYSTWTKTPDQNGYVLDITGFATSLPTYTLTVHYKDASGNPVTITDSAVYNDKAVDLTSGSYTDSKSNTKPAGTAVTTYYGTQQHKFLGWYEYKNGETGDLLSTQANYGLRLTRKQEIIALYDENHQALPNDGWSVHIDENQVNKELTTSTTGVFYNDTIVRVRNGADVKATLPSGYKIGVIVVCDNKTNKTINGYNPSQLTQLANAVGSGSTRKTSSGLSITNMQASQQTQFNRTDIAVRSDFAKTNGAKYCVYAYFYDGSTYSFSTVSDVKTYK